MKIDRRQVLAGLGGGALFSPLVARSKTGTVARVRGANDDIRVAVIGVRSRGRDHMHGFARLPGVRVVALCDVDPAMLDSALADFRKRQPERAVPDTVLDFRKLLERADVDAVSIATPNHTHTWIAMHAMAAGKDVYVEKPVSHNLREGEALVRAAQKTGRVVQAGTQCRSSTGIRAGIDFVHAGKLGAVRVARGLCYKPRPSIGKVAGEQPIPQGIDYDLWCGPAEKSPLTRRSLHYDWHWVWSTGNGDLGNQGIHQMDLCRWAMGVDRLPDAVETIGGRVGYDDDGETPNTMMTVLEYPSAQLVFEVRGLTQAKGVKEMDRFLGVQIGCVIHCEHGYLVIPDYSRAVAHDLDGRQIERWEGGGDHYQNFVDAVRARDPQKLNGPVVDGHLSSALCHLGNDSQRLAALAAAESIGQRALRCPTMAEGWRRMQDHLIANEVDLAMTPLTAAARLELDETGAFRGPLAERAEELARGTYRAGFELPVIG
jgi:predicted dehydrogenase